QSNVIVNDLRAYTMGVEELLDWIMDSGGSYHITYMRDLLIDFEEYDDGNILLSDVKECHVPETCKVQVQMRDGSSFVLENVRYALKLRRNLISLGTGRANYVYTLDGQAVTRKTLKGRKQLGEYQTGWKIKTDNVLDSCNQRNMGFNKSGKYKKTFIGSGVGTSSVQVLQGVEFEVEPQKDHTFEVEPHGNVNHVDGSQEAEIWATKGLLDKAKRNVLGMEIVRDQSGNTPRVSQSRFYNGELVQTLLERHSILSLEGSLSGDCNVEKNGKWSCIYAVGSQEYQVVCTRPDIASTDVGMLDGFDRGIQTYVQVFIDFDYAMGRKTTAMGRLITGYGLMIQGCAGR
nr:zinc finger, CCHC-type [Tanacetum cinerariifolium]GFA24634.1 zinc finger, CCHC-type [Tanacetum cinerariifolium]